MSLHMSSPQYCRHIAMINIFPGIDVRLQLIEPFEEYLGHLGIVKTPYHLYQICFSVAEKGTYKQS